MLGRHQHDHREVWCGVGHLVSRLVLHRVCHRVSVGRRGPGAHRIVRCGQDGLHGRGALLHRRPAGGVQRVPVSANVWGHWLELTSGSGVFAQGRLDVGTGVLLREQAAARRSAGRCSTSAAGTASSGWRSRSPSRVHGDRGRRQRACASCWPTRTPPRSGSRTGSPRAFPTRSTRRRRTTRSGRTRRSGSARRPCTSCCSPGCRGWRPSGRARLVVGKNLGADSLAALAHRAGLPDGEGREREGVPRAGVATRLTVCWL